MISIIIHLWLSLHSPLILPELLHKASVAWLQCCMPKIWEGTLLCNIAIWCFGLRPFWIVAVSVCGRFGLWPFGLWPFRSVAVSVCGRSGLWPIRFVVIPVCGRSGLWPLWPVTIHQCLRSHGTNTDFDLNWAFLEYNYTLNSPMALKWCTKREVV